jgi:hypothetical protein
MRASKRAASTSAVSSCTSHVTLQPTTKPLTYRQPTTMPRLLQLPGELRNYIYSYALAEEEGVCYRKDERGIGWLCLHPPATVERATKLEPISATSNTGVEDIEQGSSRKRRKTSHNEPAKTSTKDTSTASRVRIGNHIILNQLQFVCRQLRETQGLGLRYNDISIFDTMDNTQDLLMSTTTQQTGWLRKIIIKAEEGWDTKSKTETEATTTHSREDLWETVNREYPNLNFEIHLSTARIDSENFFVSGLVYLYARGKAGSISRFTKDAETELLLRRIAELNTETVKMVQPSAVRTFPWDMVFDEAAVREQCQNGPDVLAQYLREDPDLDADVLVEIAREWYTKGF